MDYFLFQQPLFKATAIIMHTAERVINMLSVLGQEPLTSGPGLRHWEQAY